MLVQSCNGAFDVFGAIVKAPALIVLIEIHSVTFSQRKPATVSQVETMAAAVSRRKKLQKLLFPTLARIKPIVTW